MKLMPAEAQQFLGEGSWPAGIAHAAQCQNCGDCLVCFGDLPCEKRAGGHRFNGWSYPQWVH